MNYQFLFEWYSSGSEMTKDSNLELDVFIEHLSKTGLSSVLKKLDVSICKDCLDLSSLLIGWISIWTMKP